MVGGILAAFIPLNAAFFQLIMLHVEDRSYSWITALYWTVVTMSTLGFGDIVFYSDAGRLFSIWVLLSGILLLVALPYVSIEFLIEPLRRAQELSRVPRRAPSGERGHVIVSRYDPNRGQPHRATAHRRHPVLRPRGRSGRGGPPGGPGGPGPDR